MHRIDKAKNRPCTGNDEYRNKAYNTCEKRQELFIGGLPASTNDQQLREFLEQYGSISTLKLKKYKDGQCRGFAIVKFKQRSTSEYFLAHPRQVFAGKLIEYKPAISKAQSTCLSEYELSRQVYVGSISEPITEEDILTLFSSYGAVEEVKTINNLNTGHRRGFCFVVFKKPEEAQLALETPIKEFQGCTLECKPALAKVHYYIDSSKTPSSTEHQQISDTETQRKFPKEVSTKESRMSSEHTKDHSNRLEPHLFSFYAKRSTQIPDVNNLVFRRRTEAGSKHTLKYFNNLICKQASSSECSPTNLACSQ